MDMLRFCLGLLIAAVSAGSWARTSHAASGSVLNLPLPGIKNRSGLRMEIDTRWVSGCGYRPVRVRISTQPFGPAPADRTLEVRIRPRGWQGGTKAGAVRGTVEIA